MRRLCFLILLIPATVDAGTLTQTASFRFQSHGSSSTGFNQISPALGPLNAIEFEAHGDGTSDGFRLENNTPNRIEFNAIATDGFNSVAGTALFTHVFALTLDAGRSTSFGYVIGGFTTRSLLTDRTVLDQYVGNSFAPDTYYGNGESIQVDNPAIDVIHSGTVFPNWLGGIKATFYYGDTFPTPVPTSAILFATGIAAALCLRRWA